jgi:hypothetical protein
LHTLIPKGLTNENRLLLACARKILTERDLEEARSAISGGIDCKLLGRHAQDHGLSPLLYWHLQQSFPTAFPSGLETKQQFFQNNARNLFLSGALLNILEALQTAGVRALAYKGPTLAAILYGDIPLREMSDLDILIDHTSFPAARDALARLGYQPLFVHSRKQEKARLRSDCECEFSRLDGKVMVDLHWQITAPHLAQHFNFDELWQRRRMVTIGQKPVPTFSAEDTALVLAVHGGKHLWQRLSWLADFAESLRQNLDWQALRVRAREARAERMLLLALALAQGLLQVELPAELAAAITHDAVVQPIARDIARELFNEKDNTEQDRTRWSTLFQLADSRWDGMRGAMHFALASGPREWEAVRLPDSLFAFYPLLRMASVLRSAPSIFLAARRSGRHSE